MGQQPAGSKDHPGFLEGKVQPLHRGGNSCYLRWEGTAKGKPAAGALCQCLDSGTGYSEKNKTRKLFLEALGVRGKR